MNKVFKYILIIVLLINTVSCLAVNNIDLFNKANQFYKNKQYDKAITIYNELMNKDIVNSDIYYNLGNAYYKNSQIAEAILFYERALKLNPDDEDIKFNLKIANLKIVDKINDIPKLFFIEWYESIYQLFSSDTWAILTVIFIWLFFSLLLIYFLIYNITLRKIAFFSSIVSLIIVILFFIFALEQSSVENSNNNAIILSPSVYVKNSPDDKSTDLFILHEGTKIEILDKVDNWNKIKIADGNVGWIPNSTIEII